MAKCIVMEVDDKKIYELLYEDGKQPFMVYGDELAVLPWHLGYGCNAIREKETGVVYPLQEMTEDKNGSEAAREGNPDSVQILREVVQTNATNKPDSNEP